MKRERIVLHEAVIKNDFEKTNDLIKDGGDINVKDANGITALHYAAQNNYIKIIKLLLENKAEVDAQDTYGNTPLFKAVVCFRGNGDAITCLLQAGADRHLQNNYGHSPLEMAKAITNYQIYPLFDVNKNT